MSRCGGSFILPTEKEKKQETGQHIEILGLRHWIVLVVYLILYMMQSVTPGTSYWLVQSVKSQLNLDDFEKMSNVEDFYNWWDNNHRRFWEGDFVKYNVPYGFLRISTQRSRLVDAGNTMMVFDTSQSLENPHFDTHLHNDHTGGTRNCDGKRKVLQKLGVNYACGVDPDTNQDGSGGQRPVGRGNINYEKGYSTDDIGPGGYVLEKRDNWALKQYWDPYKNWYVGRGGAEPWKFVEHKEESEDYVLFQGDLGTYTSSGYFVDYDLMFGTVPRQMAGLSGQTNAQVTPGIVRPTAAESNETPKWTPALSKSQGRAFQVSEITNTIKSDIKAFRKWNFLHVQATRLTTISAVVYNPSYDMWVNLHLTLETPYGWGSGSGGLGFARAQVTTFRPNLKETSEEASQTLANHFRMIIAFYIVFIVMREEILFYERYGHAGATYFFTLAGVADVGIVACTMTSYILRMVHFHDASTEVAMEAKEYRNYKARADKFQEILQVEGCIFLFIMFRFAWLLRLDRRVYLLHQAMSRSIVKVFRILLLDIMIVKVFYMIGLAGPWFLGLALAAGLVFGNASAARGGIGNPVWMTGDVKSAGAGGALASSSYFWNRMHVATTLFRAESFLSMFGAVTGKHQQLGGGFFVRVDDFEETHLPKTYWGREMDTAGGASLLAENVLADYSQLRPCANCRANTNLDMTAGETLAMREAKKLSYTANLQNLSVNNRVKYLPLLMTNPAAEYSSFSFWGITFLTIFLLVVTIFIFNLFRAAVITDYFHVHLVKRDNNLAPHRWSTLRWSVWIFPDLIQRIAWTHYQNFLAVSKVVEKLLVGSGATKRN